MHYVRCTLGPLTADSGMRGTECVPADLDWMAKSRASLLNAPIVFNSSIACTHTHTTRGCVALAGCWRVYVSCELVFVPSNRAVRWFDFVLLAAVLARTPQLWRCVWCWCVFMCTVPFSVPAVTCYRRLQPPRPVPSRILGSACLVSPRLTQPPHPLS